jgi:hypothetical protein
MPRQAAASGTLLFLLFGPLIWAAHLLVVYAGHASLCATGGRLPLLNAAALPWLLGLVTAGALLLLGCWPHFRLLASSVQESRSWSCRSERS